MTTAPCFSHLQPSASPRDGDSSPTQCVDALKLSAASPCEELPRSRGATGMVKLKINNLALEPSELALPIRQQLPLNSRRRLTNTPFAECLGRLEAIRKTAV